MISDYKKDPTLHKVTRAKTRKEIRDVYSNYEIKRDMANQMSFDTYKEAYSSFYAGIDPRRKVEMADAGMIEEDQGAMSNLPKEGYQRTYPRTGFSFNPFVDDSTKE
jgi:hypothetical protein